MQASSRRTFPFKSKVFGRDKKLDYQETHPIIVTIIVEQDESDKTAKRFQVNLRNKYTVFHCCLASPTFLLPRFSQ